MNDKILKLFTGFVLLCSAFSVSAQTIFDVELVFFKRIGELHITGQQEPIPLESEDNQFILTESNSVLPEGYTVLQRSQQKLEGVYHRLRTSSNMRPLLHIGWRQELNDKSETPWLSFNLKDAPDQTGLLDFQGLIRLSRNQGLVLESQVVGFKENPESTLEASANNLEASTSNNGSATDTEEVQESSTSDLNLPFEVKDDSDKAQASTENGQAEFDENLQIPDALSGFFEMSETLKVKLGKLYYIDHPTMGLLVKVTPHQASLEEQDALN